MPILRVKPPRPADTIRTDFLTHPDFSEVPIAMPPGSQPPGPILVTGASGFVGSAIAAALRDAAIRSACSSARRARASTSIRAMRLWSAIFSIAPRSRGAPRRALSHSRRRRLPALGALRRRYHARQRRRHSHRHGRGAARGRRADRLHQLGRDLRPARRRPRRRDPASAATPRDRRLQAQQGHRRGSRRRHGRAATGCPP